MDRECSPNGADGQNSVEFDPAQNEASIKLGFDPVTISLHWVSALLVLALFTSAWLHTGAVDAVSRVLLLQIHRSLGLVLWLATLVRLLWRATKADPPQLPAGTTRLHRLAVRLSEFALYLLLVCLPAAGLAASLLRGRAFPLLLGEVPQLLSPNRSLAVQIQWIHETGAWILAIMVMLHACAALMHHFLLRDHVLKSMIPMLASPRKSRPDASAS